MSTRFNKAVLLTIQLSLGLTLMLPVSVFGQQACEIILKGAQFLHQKNPTLHTSKPVELTNTTGAQKPSDKIINWLRYLENSSKKHSSNPTALNLIKEHYFKTYLTKVEDVPDSFYQLQVQIAREQGHGTIQLTETTKKQLRETSLKDQKDSLESWLDYFLSPDSESYPMWAKYWSFNGMVKLGKFNPEDGTFSNRSKGQMSAFPELNREAFAIVIDAIVKKVSGQSLESIQDPKLLSLLDGANFGKLYGHALKQVTTKTVAPKSENGKWIVYQQGSDPTPLVDSLKGWNTGWCTAGFETAKSQLQNGDFHVFYSQNSDGKFNIPRIAIRMQGADIAEVRGIAANQNLDPHIAGTNVLNKKISEFGNKGQVYQKKSADMNLLTEIETKHQKNIELSKSDLRFLYEVDANIEGFGYQKDPRIEEITSQRDKSADLAYVFGVKSSQVLVNTNNRKEALTGDILYYFGDLDLSDLTSANGFKLPNNFKGNLYLTRLQSAKGLKLPNNFKGNLYLQSLTSSEGLILPTNFTGSLHADNLISAEQLILPTHFEGNLFLGGLKSAEGLTLPTHFKGDLNLISLTSSEGLTLPINFEGDLYLNELSSADGLVLPTKFNGNLYLNGLKSALGLMLPTHFKGHLSLSNLTSSKGLTLPINFEGDLYLNALSSADGLVLPTKFNGNLYLNGLTSTEGLTLPTHFKGDLNLSKLKSAHGLTLPHTFNGKLFLNGLTSAEGLKLPENFKGDLTLGGLKSALGLTLPTHFIGTLNLNKLLSAKGLVLPRNFIGTLHVSYLNSPEGLTLPTNFKGSLSLYSLTSAKGLVLPSDFIGDLDLRNLISTEGLTLPKNFTGGLNLKTLASTKGLIIPEGFEGTIYLNKNLIPENFKLPQNSRAKIEYQ